MTQTYHISRFTDAADEPTKTLTPIQGYETKPLLPLEQAIAEVDPPIVDLSRIVWIAKRNSRNPSDGLNPDESASIHLYTMEWVDRSQNLYSLLNQKLRSAKRSELKPWFSYLKLLLTALYKLPSVQTTIWRGVRGDIAELYQDDFIWWGFSSCTDTMKVAEKFVARTDVRTLFMIDCMNGKAIRSHSHFQDEEEILLMPGTFLRVIDKCNPAADLHIIRLREETPPYELLASPLTPTPATSTLSLEKLPIADDPKLSSEGASIASTEPESATSPPEPLSHKNEQLEELINEKRNESSISFPLQCLTDDDMEIVTCYLLKDNETLTTLDLRNNQIGDRGAQDLGDALQKNSTLTKLSLSQNRIRDEGAQYLGNGLRKNSTLTELSLSHNQIGDEGAQHLGEALQKNSTLMTLFLGNNQIGDRGAQHVTEALQKNSTLTELSLSSNRIGDRGAQHLGEALQKNSTLMTFYLYSNQIGKICTQHLKNLPTTKENLSVYI